MSSLDWSDIERRYDVQAVERENEQDDERRDERTFEEAAGVGHEQGDDGDRHELQSRIGGSNDGW